MTIEKTKVTFAQVTAALAAGFISPLNSAKKLVGKMPAMKAGKIRRNATAKLNWLLDSAKAIVMDCIYREIDDSYHSAGLVHTTKESVLDFINGNRSVNTWLTLDDNGQPKCLSVTAGYWQKSYKITF